MSGSGANLRPVLILAYDFPPSTEPGAQRLNRFYRYLPQYGYRPYVVTSDTQKTPLEGVVHAPRPHKNLLDYANRAALKLGLHHDVGLPWTLSATASAERLLERVPVAGIISTFPPIGGHLTALLLRRKRKLPWIADFRDPMLGSPFRPNSGPGHLLDKFIEPRVIAGADAVVTVTDVLAADFKKAYPAQADKFQLIWNGYDPADPIGPLPIPNRPYRVLSHIGSFYSGRSPAKFLGSVERLLGAGKIHSGKIKMHFVGEIDQQTAAENREAFARLCKLECLLIEKPIPRAAALKVMGETDYLLLADNNANNVGQGVPAKLFEYIRIGRPILAMTSPGSPVQRILSKSGILHEFLHKEDSDEVTDTKVERFLSLSSDSLPLSNWIRNEFDGVRQTGTLAALMDRVLDKHGSQASV